MMTKEFSYSLWNLFNYTGRVQQNKKGNLIYYALDGVWKISDASTGKLITTLETAIDMAAWLNAGEYAPEGYWK